MNKKKEYRLLINNHKKAEIVYPFHYGMTKDARIELSKKGFGIVINTSSQITSDKILENASHIFAEAIRKAFMLYLIRYSKAVSVDNFLFSSDGNNMTFPGSSFPISSMINGELSKQLPDSWNREIVYSFILNYKEKYRKPASAIEPDYIIKERSRLMASVNAFLIAKSKRYEYERFSYLWMAMNGLYGYISKVAYPSGKIITKKGKEMNVREAEAMEILCQAYGMLDTEKDHWVLENKDKPVIADKTINIIKNLDWDTDLEKLKQILFEGVLSAEIQENIHNYPKPGEKYKCKTYDITTKAYMLVYLPYYLRCKYFHANRSVPLISNNNDKILKTLHFVNILIEDFLEEAIVQWMDTDLIENRFKPMFESFTYGKQLN